MNVYIVSWGACTVEVRAINDTLALSEGLALLRRQGVAIARRYQNQATVSLQP